MRAGVLWTRLLTLVEGIGQEYSLTIVGIEMPREIVWIKHSETEPKQFTDDSMVMVIFCNRERSLTPMKASVYNWNCDNHPYDVEFYSVVKP